jgi:hypothetical protein
VHFAGFEKAQELGLDVEARITDLVEEERTSGGGADDARKVFGRAGEGAAPVPEQLRVEHVARSRGAVEGQEGCGRARRAGMNRPREHFLAGPCFPQ